MDVFPLWSKIESAGTGNPKDDFDPCIQTYLLEKSDKPRGAVVVFPGGGYSCRAPHEGEPIALKFNELGFHAFVVQYRVAPYRFPAPQRDAFRAIRLIRSRAQEWGVNPNQIATLGFSAGGHLCASTGTLYREIDADAGDEVDNFPCRPDAIIPCYPVINLTDGIAHRGSGENLLGDKINTPEAAKLDLDKRVSPDDPPAFLWHTADDGAVNVENSIRFAQAMWKAGVTCALHVFPHAPHGVGLGLDYPDIAVWPELAVKFLTVNCKFTAGK